MFGKNQLIAAFLCASSFLLLPSVISWAAGEKNGGGQNAQIPDEWGVELDGNKPVTMDGTDISGMLEDVPDAAGEAPKEEPAHQIAGDGGKVKYYCGGKNSSSVSVAGQANTVTLSGTCKKIEITGSSNKVVANRVETIVLTGMSNQVSYKRGPKGTRPSIEDTGIGNMVTKIKKSRK